MTGLHNQTGTDLTSEYQHGIAEAIEAVAKPDCLFVSLKNALPARECAHQHQQGGVGQVEVGNYCIDHLRAVAGHDKEVCPAGKTSYPSFVCPGYMLEHPYCASANADHTPMTGGEGDTIEVCADCDNEVTECDETNNCLENLIENPGTCGDMGGILQVTMNNGRQIFVPCLWTG